MTDKDSKYPYKSILVVCSVNVARSTMCEGFIKDFFSKNRIEGIEVRSGGISSHARDGMLISMDAKFVMDELGIKLSDTYTSMDLKKRPEIIQNADLIITLTEKHKKEILRFNEAQNKAIYTLKEFGGECGDIEDPSMKGVNGFRIIRDQIKRCLDKGLATIFQIN